MKCSISIQKSIEKQEKSWKIMIIPAKIDKKWENEGRGSPQGAIRSAWGAKVEFRGETALRV